MTTTYTLLDLFAGPGGWDEAAKSLGVSTYGIEIDKDACATAWAAGHPRLQADVLDIHPSSADEYGWNREIFVASPPCVAFSKLNKGHARKHVDELCDAVRAGNWKWGLGDLPPTVLLPLSMGPWIDFWVPTVVAFEQVPSVLPVWKAYADWMRTAYGYSVVTGIVDAADYGTPQHRKRAVLMARYVGDVALPTPTHGVGSQPYINAGDALGWDRSETRKPERINDQSGTPVDLDWPWKRPALTIAGRNLMNHPGANANRFNGKTKSRNDGFWLTEQEMAVLQGFRPDYPFVGGLTSVRKQIGNVVPVPLAKAILASLI